MYDYDAIVVGSGAGGGSIAFKLAEQGRKVAIIEAGDFYNTDSFNRFELLAFKRMWWDPRWTSNYERSSGSRVYEMALGMGRCVGGSTTIFTAVAHRAPEENFEEWYDTTRVLNENGLPFSYPDIEQHYSKSERETNVRRYTDWDSGVQKISQGFAKLGLEVLPVSSYVDNNCDHHGCLFGCPTGAKKGSLLAYVIPAMYLDATLITNSYVMKVLLRKDTSEKKKLEAYGVRFMDSKTGLERELTSKIVILAGGALETPQILLRSNLAGLTEQSKSSAQIGKNLGVNTATIMFGRFEDTLNNWLLHPLSGHLIDFALEKDGGYILEMSTCMQGPLGFSRVLVDDDNVPMIGRELTSVTKNYKHMAGIFLNVHDKNDGEVTLDENGREKFFKPVTTQDLQKINRARTLALEGLKAAGAKETYNTGFMSHHIQGTCRMGEDTEKTVTDSTGEMHDVSRLYVCDASLIPSVVDANPSLTIYALADRMSNTLKNSLYF